MNLIVNVDKNWAIGNKGSLINPISEDLKNFKRLTVNNAVIMGRSTLLSLPGGKPLKNRKNVVLSSTMKEDICGTDGLYVVNSIESLLKLLASEEFTVIPESKIFVIGGASVYKELLPYCTEAIVTKVDCVSPEADAFFPNLDEMQDWNISEESENLSDGKKAYKFVKYLKNRLT